MNISSLNVIQIIIMLLLFVVIIFLVRQNIAIKHERRIARYSIEPVNKKFSSLFDNIKKYYDNLIIGLRKPLGKSFIIKKLSKRYEKYVSYGEDRKAIDYIINKLIISFAFVLLVIFSNVLQVNKTKILLFETKEMKFLVFIILAIFGYFIYDIYLFFLKIRKNKQVKNQMLRAIIIMNDAFKSGKSTLQAVEIASRELSEPLNHEFEKMYKEMKYGISIDVVFERFAKRITVEEAKYISSSLTILNKSGGNIIKVFSSIERNLFDKKKMREELKSSMSSSILTIIALIIMPIILVWIINKLNPEYFLPLFLSPLGYLILFLIVILFSLYVFALIKIILRLRCKI